MKKFTACICCAALVLSMAAANVTAYAAQADNAAGAVVEQQESKDSEYVQRGEFTCIFSYNEEYATITGFDEKMYKGEHPEYSTNHTLEFPFEVESEKDSSRMVPVKVICFDDSSEGIGWKYGKDSLTFTKVIIPNTVEEIDSYAYESDHTFTNLKNLQYVEFEKGTQFRDFFGVNFSGCTALKRIGVNGTDKFPSIKENELVINKYFWDGAFEGCESLQSITLPNGLEAIRSSTFKGCSSLKKVNIPSTIQWIGSGAFMNCTSLNSVTFDLKSGKCDLQRIKGLTGEGAFENCTSLEQLKLPLTTNSGGYDIGNSCFKNTGLKGIDIPPCVNKIEDQAFAGTKLESAAMKTPKGEKYGIGIFGKNTTISEHAFVAEKSPYSSKWDEENEIKPIIAGYENSSAKSYYYGHDGCKWVPLGDWDPYTTRGDINGDGKPAATDDLVAFIRYMNGNTKNVNEDQLDVDGDGQKATTRDLVRLIKIMNS